MSKPSSNGPAVVDDESVLSAAPFILRRVVKWGDADAAGVVYTPRFLHFAIEAAESWFRRATGTHWVNLPSHYGIETPPIAANLTFHHALWPDDRLDLTVHLTKIGRSSYTVAVSGRNQDGVPCFDNEVTYVAIDPKARKSLPLPEALRGKLAAYQDACGRADP